MSISLFLGIAFLVGHAVHFVEVRLGWSATTVEGSWQILGSGINHIGMTLYLFLFVQGIRARTQKVRETRRCPVPQEWIRLEDVIEIYPSPQLLGFRLLEATAVLLILIVALGAAASYAYVSIWSVPVALLVFGLVGLYIRVERDVPLLRFDAEGLTSRRSRTSIWTFSVPWSQIDSCVLVNRRDVHSHQSVTYPLFYDVDGKRRPSPGMWTWLTIDKESSDRALGYLKARFPKLDFDNWEFK